MRVLKNTVKYFVLSIILSIFVTSCYVSQYSKRYFKVTEIVDDSTYIAKIQIGDWIQSYEIVQYYEDWEVGDTIYFTKYNPKNKKQ